MNKYMINNNRGYLIKNDQQDYYKNNNINNFMKYEFKYEKAKRPNNKIAYEKLNYNEYCQKKKMDKNIDKNYNGYEYYKNAINNFEKYNNLNNNNNNNRNKNIINKNNNRMNKKIISEKNMNQMRPKKGGGRSNKLYQKYGFN